MNYQALGTIIAELDKARQNKIPALNRARTIQIQSEMICDAIRSEADPIMSRDELKDYTLKQAVNAIILYESLQ